MGVGQRARELLHLDAIKEQSLSIATFGSDRGRMKVCPNVNVGICFRGNPSMSLSLHYVVLTICEPLVGQPMAAYIEQHPHPQGWN